jgi:serine O-acetyltransferase
LARGANGGYDPHGEESESFPQKKAITMTHKSDSKGSAKDNAIWEQLRHDAMSTAKQEPEMAAILKAYVIDHETFAEALAHFLGQKLGAANGNMGMIRDVCRKAFEADPAILQCALKDMRASRERDPAYRTWLQPFLYFKGPAALHTYRVAHWCWNNRKPVLAYHLQSLCSQIFQVDIHPAARLGSGIFIDHATGVVIGETSVVSDDVSILHGVTLGGSGKDQGDRHPKIGRGVLLSVGATVLGNIKVGEQARVAACSVVLDDVPPHATVAGIPAKLVRVHTPERPAEVMEHRLKN